jgi:hypothetical protein
LAIKLVADGLGGGCDKLAVALFTASTLVIGLLAVKTFERLIDGNLLPVCPPAAHQALRIGAASVGGDAMSAQVRAG